MAHRKMVAEAQADEASSMDEDLEELVRREPSFEEITRETRCAWLVNLTTATSDRSTRALGLRILRKLTAETSSSHIADIFCEKIMALVCEELEHSEDLNMIFDILWLLTNITAIPLKPAHI